MKKVLHIITNKFLLTGVVFVIWVAYFDQNDWFTHQERKQKLEDTKENITYLKSEIAEMRNKRDGIKNDPAILEEYAREHYHMKKDNEDVFVFE